MTYFKYVEREVDNQVNWAEIGKNMTDMLKNEAEARFKKKKEIADKSRQYGEQLSNSPTGDFDAGNTFAANYANDMQQYRLMQDRMLQNGDLSLRDYTRNRQNSVDGTKQVFDLAKEYQAEYKTKMDRWNNSESSKYEQWSMEQAEGLNNLGTVGTFINPTNGVLSIGKKVKGKGGVMELSKDPNDFVTVAELRSRLKQQYDRYDVDAAAKTAANQLGVVQKDVVKYASEGNLNTIISKIDAKEGNYGLEGEQFAATYKEWEEDQVSAMMVNGFNVMSVLTDRKVTNPATGEEYVPTFDEKAAKNDPNLIFIDRSTNPAGVPKFTDEQEKVVRETLKIAIRASIDEKTTAKSAGFTTRETATSIGQGNKEKQEESIVTEFSRLFYDTADGKKTAADAIRAFNPNIKSILPSDDGNSITFTMKDGSFETIRLDDTNEIDFIKRGANFALPEGKKIADIDEVVKRSGKFKYDNNGNVVLRPFTTFDFTSESGTLQQLPFDEAFIRNEGGKFDGNKVLENAGAAITTAQESQAKSDLNSMIAQIPGLVEGDVKVRGYHMGQGKGLVVTIDGNDMYIDLEDSENSADQFEDVKKAILAKAAQRFAVTDLKGEKQKQYVEQYGTVKPTSNVNTNTGGGANTVPIKNKKNPGGNNTGGG